MAMMDCPECGKQVSDKAPACPDCGMPIAPPQQEKAFCSKCGKDINKDAVVCPACGVPTSNYQLQQQQTPAPINVTVSNVNTNANVNTNTNMMGMAGFGRPKNKWTAILLCIFLGYFGGHKFYEGKVMMGIIYIFTVGLFMIGVIIDFFVLLGKPNPYYV